MLQSVDMLQIYAYNHIAPFNACGYGQPNLKVRENWRLKNGSFLPIGHFMPKLNWQYIFRVELAG